MDEIQKVLIKAGRKDLAQQYYQKTAFQIDPEWEKYREEVIETKAETVVNDIVNTVDNAEWDLYITDKNALRLAISKTLERYVKLGTE